MLRLELAPLGVRVLSVITGAVETNIFANTAAFELPGNSLYRGVEDRITRRARGEDIEGQQMKAHVFAEKLVADVLGGKTGVARRGKWSTSIGWLVWALPGFLIVCDSQDSRR